VAETCYRHPGRETGVSCSNCGRPICTECMTSTPVGMRCPECAGQRTRVRRGLSAVGVGAQPVATYALLALNVIAFVAELGAGGGAASVEGGGTLTSDGGLCGNAIDDGGFCGGQSYEGGEWYRILTAAFLHAGPLHLLMNMFVLYVLGTLVEPAIGTLRFVAIYVAALLAGSFGALLLTDPNEVTVGASGAIYGLMGAAVVIARRRGLEQVASQIGLWLALNLALTFSIPGISIGGHLGGLAGGILGAMLVSQAERRAAGRAALAIEGAGILAIAVASVAGSLWAASQSGGALG
jgi:membrane associated rhomboid family serine protease